VSAAWGSFTTGEGLYRDGVYAEAEKHYRLFWQRNLSWIGTPNEHQDYFIRAAVGLCRTLVAQRKVDDIAAILKQVEASIPRLKEAALSQQNQLQFDFWRGRLLQLRDDSSAAAELFTAVGAGTADPRLRLEAALRRGECQVAAEDWTAAKATLQAVIAKLGPGEPALQRDAERALLRVHMAAGDFTGAHAKIVERLKTAEGRDRVELAILGIQALLGLEKADAAYVFYQKFVTDSATYAESPLYYPIVRALAQALKREKKLDTAIHVLERLVELVRGNENRLTVLVELAETNALAAKPDVAIAHYRTFLERGPDDDERQASVQLRIAELYEGKRDFAAASKEYETVYRTEAYADPERYRAAHSIARILQDEENAFEKAVAYYVGSAQLRVDANRKADGYFMAAQAYDTIEDHNNAALHFQTVADKFPASKLACDARLRQGIARFNAERYRLASTAFQQVIEDCADQGLVAQAMREKGRALQRARDYAPAIIEFRKFVDAFPEHQDAPGVLLEATQAAVAGGVPLDGIKYLTMVIEKFPESEAVARALYDRALLNFSHGSIEAAKQDSATFVDRFRRSHPQLAPDVYLWMGDHYVSTHEYQKAIDWFLLVCENFNDSPDAPEALYEAAKAAYIRSRSDNRDFDKSLTLLVQLETRYGDTAKARIRAQASFLRGDIATVTGDFEEAARWFAAAKDLVPGQPGYYAALGRLGECWYSLASARGHEATLYQKALDCFNEIVAVESLSPSFRVMARYRAARVYEMLKKPEQARTKYAEIFYDPVVRERVVTDWYYFARAGYDLARLLETNKDWEGAIRAYQRLADAGIPVSDDARRKATELQKLFVAGEKQESGDD
jgi:tetratricopeptide (TPR) repeat protein